MVMDQYQAYGDEWSGVNLADSRVFGLYNPEKLRLNLLVSKKLFKQSVQFPIHLMFLSISQIKSFVNQVQSLKTIY